MSERKRETPHALDTDSPLPALLEPNSRLRPVLPLTQRRVPESPHPLQKTIFLPLRFTERKAIKSEQRKTTKSLIPRTARPLKLHSGRLLDLLKPMESSRTRCLPEAAPQALPRLSIQCV